MRTTATPTYLSELVQIHAPPRTLRCSDAPMLVVPRIHTELARRAFSVAAPSRHPPGTWNSLPADIRLCDNIFDTANLSVRPSVGLSVRYVPVPDENGLTYRHSFFTIR